MVFEVKGAQSEVQWAAPIEQAWNYRRRIANFSAFLKRPDIGLSDRLLIASILCQPADQRPWGIVTWLADFYQTTRQTIYTIANSILYPFVVVEDQSSCLSDHQSAQSEPVPEASSVPNHQIERAILKMAFPGSVSIRPMREILREIFGVTPPSIGFISQLLSRAGQLAGQFLSQLDYEHLEGIVALRDETFFNGKPILLLVEPTSGMIVHATAEDDRKSDTWATILLTLEDQNLQIKGLVEDMARAFPASVKLINHPAQSKKDHWHLMRNGGKIKVSLENRAYRMIDRMDKIEQKVNQKWSDHLVEEYLKVDKELDKLMNELSNFEFCLEATNEALEIVEVKSGRICDFESHDWYLSEIVDVMSRLSISDIKSFCASFSKAARDGELLTHLLWVAPLVANWRQKANLYWGEVLAAEAEMAIARHWKLGQLLINGYKDWQEAYNQSQEHLKLLGVCSKSKELVQQLCSSLDASPRASSLIENINGQLKRFLNNRRSLANQESLQKYLNLFVLWYNSHLFERGKRKGKSPFEWANMDLPKGDWLTWLGFPKSS